MLREEKLVFDLTMLSATTQILTRSLDGLHSPPLFFFCVIALTMTSRKLMHWHKHYN